MKTDVTPPALFAYRPAGSASGSGFARRMGRVYETSALGPFGRGHSRWSPACGSARVKLRRRSPLLAAAVAPSGRTAVRSLLPQGVGSCAATACHGGVSSGNYPSRVLRNEYTTWVTQDEHANAYQVLTSARSQRMVSLLPGKRGPGLEDARCLACHATSGTGPLERPPTLVRQDGVGCESCHGPAELWLGAHTTGWWSGLTPTDKEAQLRRCARPGAHRAGRDLCRLPRGLTRHVRLTTT